MDLKVLVTTTTNHFNPDAYLALSSDNPPRTNPHSPHPSSRLATYRTPRHKNDPLSIKNLTLSFYADNPENVRFADSPRIQELQIGYEYSRSAFHVDQFSRVVFPLVFSVFNTVYWLYFLSK